MFKTSLDVFSDGYVTKPNNPVSVIASFSSTGDIRPLYVRLTDENQEQHDCKILRLINVKPERWDGVLTLRFICMVAAGDCEKQMSLIYFKDSTMWSIGQ